jgi:hypothetical protein
MGRKRKADAVVSSESNSHLAQKMTEKRTKTSTKDQYRGKITHIIEWCEKNHPSAIVNRELTIPIEKDVALEFFGFLSADANQRDALEGPQDLPEGAVDPISHSTLTGYRSAISDLYRQHGQKLSVDLDAGIKGITDGYKKLINSLRQRGLMRAHEGKSHCRINGYQLLCNKFMTRDVSEFPVAGNWSFVTFTWAYFTLLWNLISRTDSVDCLMLQHFEWEGDAMIIEEQGHKVDQTGENKFGKHIYANPLEPSVCPYLALAVYIFSANNRVGAGTHQLFAGTNSKDRFYRNLMAVCGSLTSGECIILGCDPHDISSHSMRKGAGTYCMGQIGGPSPVTVTLRMGHTLGPVRDRYIFMEPGGDQLCGRMVVGLPFEREEFSALPPHFSVEVTNLLTEDYWNEILPMYSSYTESFRRCLPYLLASLLYHHNYLRTNLSASHPIFHARVFIRNQLLERLKAGFIMVNGFWTDCGMKATGIPQHIAITKQMHDLGTRLGELEAESAKFRETVTTTLPTIIAGQVAEEIRPNFIVEG